MTTTEVMFMCIISEVIIKLLWPMTETKITLYSGLEQQDVLQHGFSIFTF